MIVFNPYHNVAMQVDTTKVDTCHKIYIFVNVNVDYVDDKDQDQFKPAYGNQCSTQLDVYHNAYNRHVYCMCKQIIQLKRTYLEIIIFYVVILQEILGS